MGGGVIRFSRSWRDDRREAAVVCAVFGSGFAGASLMGLYAEETYFTVVFGASAVLFGLWAWYWRWTLRRGARRW